MGEAPSFDAKGVTKAQGEINTEAAKLTQLLGMTNQQTPFGSLTYKQVGKWPDGTPRYEAVTKLSPKEQQIYNKSNRLQSGVLDEAKGVLGGLDLAGGPDYGPSVDATGITKSIMDLGNDYYSPILDQETNKLKSQLAAQGIAPGTEAYNDAINLDARNRGDVMTKLLLEGQGTALDAARFNMEKGQASYFDPLRALSSLMTGQAPTSPSFVQTPQAGVQPADYASNAATKYQGDLSAYNNRMSSLFSIPTTLLGGWASGGF